MFKTVFGKITCAFLCVVALCAAICIPAIANLNQEDVKVYNKVAYFTPWNFKSNIDATTLTHANYAFGMVESNGEIEINMPTYLNRLISKKAENPNLKVILSLQQVDQGDFCALMKSETNFEYFLQNCENLLQTYDIDGLDVDWEYPGINIHTGAITCNNCKEDFTRLIKSLRVVVGDEKILSIACGVSQYLQQYTDFSAIDDYLDYYNLMSYDFQVGNIKGHHSNLYQASVGSGGYGLTASGGVDLMIQKGISADKINLGVPFYSLTSDGNAYVYSKIEQFLASGYEYGFDEVAQQSYLTKDGVFAVAYDDVRTLEAKVDYVAQKGLGGMMYWEYGQDDNNLTLSTAVYEAFKQYETLPEEDNFKVEITCPESFTKGEKIDFSVKATSDESSSFSYYVFVLKDGEVIFTAKNTTQTDFSFVPTASNGEYEYKVYCKDENGNLAGKTATTSK